MRTRTYAPVMISRLFALLSLWLVCFVLACATLRAAEAPTVALHFCASRALEPLAGTYERAEEIARDVQAKRVSLDEVLSATQATAAEAVKLESDLRLCVDEYRAALRDAGVADAGDSDAGVAP